MKTAHKKKKRKACMETETNKVVVEKVIPTIIMILATSKL